MRRILSGRRGGTALALLLGVSAMAMAIVLAEANLKIDISGQRSEAAQEVLGNAVGATVEPLDRVTARSLGISPREKGLVITSLARNGPAARAGVHAGDVIEQIGATRIATLNDATAVLKEAHAPITLTLNSRGHYAIVTLLISPAADGGAMEHGDEQ